MAIHIHTDCNGDAMPANISSTFDIVVDEVLTGGGTTIANPGRTFRVVGVYVTGLNGATFTLNKNNAGGTLVAQTVLATASGLNDFPCLLDGGGVGIPAALTFTTTDNLFLRSNAADSSRVVVVCEAGNPQALTVT